MGYFLSQRFLCFFYIFWIGLCHEVSRPLEASLIRARTFVARRFRRLLGMPLVFARGVAILGRPHFASLRCMAADFLVRATLRGRIVRALFYGYLTGHSAVAKIFGFVAFMWHGIFHFMCWFSCDRICSAGHPYIYMYTYMYMYMYMYII